MRQQGRPRTQDDALRSFIVVTANDWGQGKTDFALELAEGLGMRGYRVGGFCIRRVYSPSASGFATTALEGMLMRTGESIPLARQAFTKDEAVDFRRARHDGLRIGLEGIFHLDHAGQERLLSAATDDAADPHLDAYILDEVGPLLFRSRHAKRKRESRSAPFHDLALGLVDRPKPVTCLIFSDPDMQSEQALGVRRHIQAHPSRIYDRAAHWRLTPDNFRVLAGEILETTPPLRWRQGG